MGSIALTAIVKTQARVGEARQCASSAACAAAKPPMRIAAEIKSLKARPPCRYRSAACRRVLGLNLSQLRRAQNPLRLKAAVAQRDGFEQAAYGNQRVPVPAKRLDAAPATQRTGVARKA